MAYDEAMAERIRGVLDRLELRPHEALDAIRMFGGLCFVLDRKMLVGVGKERIMVRLGTARFEEGLAQGLLEPMDFTGKPLRNFAYLNDAAFATDGDLLGWIEESARFVREEGAGRPKKRSRPRPFPPR